MKFLVDFGNFLWTNRGAVVSLAGMAGGLSGGWMLFNKYAEFSAMYCPVQQPLETIPVQVLQGGDGQYGQQPSTITRQVAAAAVESMHAL